MKITIDLDHYGDFKRASTWLLGRWHTAIGADHAEAQDRLIGKLREGLRVKGLPGINVERREIEI